MPRGSRSLSVAVWVGRKLLARKKRLRAKFLYIHCVLILTMVWQRPIRPLALLVSKCGFTRTISCQASVVKQVRRHRSLLYSLHWLLAKAVRVVSVVNDHRENGHHVSRV